MSSKNLSIAKKLVIAFAGVLCVVAGTGLFSFVAVRNADEATQATTGADLLIERLDRVVATHYDQADEAHMARGSLTPDAVKQHADLYAEAGELFDDQLAAARTDAAGHAEILAALDKVGAANAAWRHDIGDIEVNLGHSSQTMPQATELAKLAHSTEMMKAFRAAAEDGHNAITAWSTAAQAAQARTMWFMQLSQIIGSGLALTISIFAGYMLWRRIALPIRKLTDCMKTLAQGDTRIEIPSMGHGDEIGDMAQTIQTFKTNAVEKLRLEAEAAEHRRLTEEERQRQEAEAQKYLEAHNRFVASITDALESLSEGDLTCRLSEAFSEEYEKIRGDFNVSAEKLQQVMLSVSANTQAIRSGTKEIAVAADDLSRRTEQQAASLEETAAALGEITATVRKTAQGATHARQVVSTARSDAEKGSGVVRQAISAMSGIEKSSQQIGQIIGVIDEIAFQTNLLALNAGVEAARAGDAGRGFAVVASEVRALAQRSAEAAKEIKGLISASTAQVEQGVDLVAETGKALERIFTQVAEIDTIVSEIATSAQDQATGLQEVNTAVNQMDQVTQQNAAMVEESTAASHTLSQETEELTRLVGRFQVGHQVEEQVVPMRSAKAPTRPALRTVAQRGGAAAKPQAQHQQDEWEEF